MKPTPWVLDGFKFFDEDSKNYIYLNSRIKEYLNIGNHESRFFLIGPKGLGKTLLLRYKSYLYHTELGSAYKFNASIKELTDNLDINYDTFSRDDLIKFQSIELWEKIWSLALWILIFKTYGIDVPRDIDRMINGATKITPIFSCLLAERHKINRFTEFRNKLLARNHEIQSGVALFIDDVDQSFEKILRDEHYNDEFVGIEDNPATKIWINAQMGLVAAIYSIYRQNSHVKIFATIRREPWEAATGTLKVNYRNHATFLQYEKDEIRQIFEKNISMMNEEDLVAPSGKNPIERFIGFDEIPHRFALDENEEPRKEDVFDFIYRHTYGRPREIVLMGLEISHTTRGAYNSKDQKEQIIDLRGLVNNLSGDLFTQYKQEIIPSFNEGQFDHFIKSMKMNVIRENELGRFPTDLLNKYFSFGLLGYATHHSFKDDGTEVLIQKFLPPATYNYNKIGQLPRAGYYFTHPSIDGRLIEHLTFLKSYNPTNIIGAGYLFYPITEDAGTLSPEAIKNYYPNSVSGDRWLNASGSFRHTLPLKDYYNEFFNNFDTASHKEHFKKDMDEAFVAFNLVSRICYGSRLEKKFGDFYGEKVQGFKKELERANLLRHYSTSLKGTDQETMMLFCSRMFGRILTAATYLFNDLKVDSIHWLLFHSELKFKVESMGETPLKTLRRCFYLEGLRQTDRSPAGNARLHSSKNALYHSLSHFEKGLLKKWLASALEEIKNVSWFEEEAHRDWLEAEVLSQVWQIPK